MWNQCSRTRFQFWNAAGGRSRRRHAFQRELIQSSLELHAGSVKATRESLGLPKVTFHRYMKKLGISVGGGASDD